ncbi:MAG: tetratricopeptide repeat protein [Alphaproteobacteria bacterium]
MLKNKLLIATSILLLNIHNVSSAATVEELERQLQQMQQQTELLQKQLLELKSTEQTNQQPQQQEQTANAPSAAVTTQPVVSPPLEQTPQVQPPAEQPVSTTSSQQMADGIKVDANGNLYGEGKESAAVSSLNIVIKNNPNIQAAPVTTSAQNNTAANTTAQSTETTNTQQEAPTTTIEQAITQEPATQQAPTQETPTNSELQNAIAKVQTGDFATAQSELTAYVADETKPDLNVAYYWLGESLFRQSQYEPAAMAFTKSYKQDNKSEIAPDALIRLSLALGLLNRTEEACKLLQHAENSFPNEKEKVAIAADERRRLNCQ